MKVNDNHKLAIFKIDRVGIFQGVSLPVTIHFVLNSNDQAIWHGLSNIRHINVNYGQ